MFVKYYTHVERSFPELLPAFTPRDLPLAERASDAYRNAEPLTVSLAVDRGGAIAKEVTIEIKDQSSGPGHATLALSWTASKVAALFPRMDADLRLQPLGPDLTQLSFEGSYQPPFGFPGDIIDRWFLHRVAEACVKNFVDGVARDLEAYAAAPPDDEQ